MIHRFVGGEKAASVRCICGAMTWAEALAFWREIWAIERPTYCGVL